MLDNLLLGRILQERCGLSPEQIEEALRLQKERGGRLGEILVREGYLKEEAVLEALSRQLGIPYLARLEPREVDAALLRQVPIAFAKRYELIPLRHTPDGVLVAAADPLNLPPLDDLRILLGGPVTPALASASAILHCIHQAYERPAAAAEVIEGMEEGSLDLANIASAEFDEPVDLLDAADEAPIIRLVNSLMYRAVKERASDIHVEPFEREVAIRYRIDGVLYNVLFPPKRLQASITSRIKIMAGLNIAEKRLPQDGRIGIKIAGRDVDIRVSTIPTAHGERVVLRLLDKEALLLNLEDLGLPPDRLPVMERLIHLSHGILLVTGPTGSGKTTTLYAALNRINSPDRNIITIEDPIEYQLKGIGQMQVNPKIDLTFANGLRSILRQDPDVIMVGEIRDAETADIAIHASLTGHLVFSTLHTNDAAGAVTRLLDMGVEPFLVSSSLLAVVAQRLVRVLCPACREPYEPGATELATLGVEPKASSKIEPKASSKIEPKASSKVEPKASNKMEAAPAPRLYRAKGCTACLGHGYRGRTGIYEFMILDDELRDLILTKKDANTIRRRAVEKGMRLLRQDGLLKAVEGVTTLEEVLRVTQEE